MPGTSKKTFLGLGMAKEPVTLKGGLGAEAPEHGMYFAQSAC